jgi:hypothetical protein
MIPQGYFTPARRHSGAQQIPPSAHHTTAAADAPDAPAPLAFAR